MSPRSTSAPGVATPPRCRTSKKAFVGTTRKRNTDLAPIELSNRAKRGLPRNATGDYGDPDEESPEVGKQQPEPVTDGAPIEPAPATDSTTSLRESLEGIPLEGAEGATDISSKRECVEHSAGGRVCPKANSSENAGDGSNVDNDFTGHRETSGKSGNKKNRNRVAPLDLIGVEHASHKAGGVDARGEDDVKLPTAERALGGGFGFLYVARCDVGVQCEGSTEPCERAKSRCRCSLM